MGKGYRKGRMGEEIRKIISEMIVGGFKDPRLQKMFSISSVEVTNDGSYATCYIILLNMHSDEEFRREEEAELIAGLQSAKGLIKKEIGRQVKLRHVPELIFKMDNSMDYGNHIEGILKNLNIPSDEEDDEDDEIEEADE